MAAAARRSLLASLAALGGAGGIVCFQEGTEYTFSRCCRVYSDDSKGNKFCWVEGFTFEACCLPEFPMHVESAYQLMREGAAHEASHKFFILAQYYCTATISPEDNRRALKGFERAAKEVQRELDHAPHTLSYGEVLFRGLGLDCEMGPNSLGPPLLQDATDPYSEWARCCVGKGLFGNKACNSVFEMMATALGSGRQRTLEQRDTYYANMSELWAFHHFTPTIFWDSDSDPSHQPLVWAAQIDHELGQVLGGSGEPSLGIAWAEHVEYLSPKFIWGVYYLTLLLKTMRKAGVGAIDLIELGAGFGSIARLIAHARGKLLGLSPPVDVRSFTIFDMRSVIDLQRWYLNKTAGSLIHQRDWSDMEEGGAGLLSARAFEGSAGGQPGAARAMWLEAGGGLESAPGAPMRVDFVDTDMRDLFSHLYSEAHSEDQELEGRRQGERPARVLIAVNSWHEFVMADFLWYYNAFVAAPTWRTGVDWILYVSNRNWTQNDAKVQLMLQPRSHFRFKVYHEHCLPLTCIRILRREE